MSYNRNFQRNDAGEKKPSKTIKWEAGTEGEYLILLSVYGSENNRKGTVSVNKFVSVFAGTGRMYTEIARKTGTAAEMRAYAESVAIDPSIILLDTEEL